MIWLWLGVGLWSGAHLMKRLMPGARAALAARIGDAAARGMIALVLGLSIVLMVIGYRGSVTDPLYTPLAGMGHLNNLLMLIAIALMGVRHSKSRLRGKLRHPMLAGFKAWAIAHLLVNGDAASVVLFGGLLAWAVLEVILISRAERRAGVVAKPFKGGTLVGDIRLLVISLIVYAAISGIHIWLGYSPFLGTYP